MNVRNSLLQEHSKKQTILIAKQVSENKVEFKEIVTLMLLNEKLISQRAAWVFSFCVENKTDILKPFLAKVIDVLDKPVHPAVVRNILRALQHTEIPKKFEGKLVNRCFTLLQKKDTPIAIKAYAIFILDKIGKKYDAIHNELKIVIENLMLTGSPAIISVGKKALKKHI